MVDHDPEDCTEKNEASGPLVKKVRAVYRIVLSGIIVLGVGSFLFLVVNSLLFGSEANWKDNIFSAINGRSLPANITGVCIYTLLLIGIVHSIVKAVHDRDSVGEGVLRLFFIVLMANEYFDGNPLLASVYLGWRDFFIVGFAFIVCVLVIGLYFLPTVLATKPWLGYEYGYLYRELHERHPQFVPLAIVNFFFGATVIGWVGCLAWAFWKFDEPDSDYVPPVGADEPPETGPYVEYYQNGKKKVDRHYKNGEPDGLWTEWHSNGKKWSENHYKNGKLDGLYAMWYPNGQKSEEAHYKNGKPDGLWTRWDQNGRKDSEVQYKDGTIVSRKEF